MREAIEALVRTSAFFALPERVVSGLPDVVQYRVTIEQAGVAHEVRFDDETATEPLRALIGRVFEQPAS